MQQLEVIEPLKPLKLIERKNFYRYDGCCFRAVTTTLPAMVGAAGRPSVAHRRHVGRFLNATGRCLRLWSSLARRHHLVRTVASRCDGDAMGDTMGDAMDEVMGDGRCDGRCRGRYATGDAGDTAGDTMSDAMDERHHLQLTPSTEDTPETADGR